MDKNEEIIKLQEGIKPAPGAPSNYGNGTTIRQIDEQGRITDVRSSGGPLDTFNVKTKEEFENPVRVGDYYYTPNRTLKAWENSPTDLIQKGKIAIGGTEAPSYEPKLGREGLAALGPVVAGATIGGPVGAAVGGIIGTFTGLMAHNAAAEKALKDWQEENVKYDTAVEFYKDEDGAVKYRFDYSKMGAGGPRSGEAVKEAQNRETKVALGDDGRLKITVSPIFASTARFQEMVDFISENYAGLSKDTENLDEVLTEIKNGVDGEARNYVTNMKLYADFANRFPNASPETIVASYTTEIAGYVDPNEMGNYQMSVLDGKDVSVKSAKDFFDSVHKMGKDKRNELVKTLSNIVYGNEEGYSDDQRAIAYGELQSLFVVSANTEKYKDSKYQGMMDADPVISFINNFAPLGLEISDVLSFLSGGSYSKQEYLNQNDFAEFLGGLAGIPAGFGLWKAGTSAVGAALKLLPGTSQLFQASLAGKGKEAFAFIKQAWQNDPSAAIKAWSADALFKTLQVGIFDAALAGTQSVVSGKDFWSEFGQDFARDAALMALFSYYDMIKYLKSVDDTLVPVYTDPKTGNMVKAEIAPGEDVPERIILAGTGEPKEEIFTSIGDSGKPEEFVTTGNGTSVYTQTGSLNIRKTRLGETVGIYRDANNTVLYYDGKSVSVSGDKINTPNLLPSGDIGIDEFPALNSGVLNTSAPNGASIEKLVNTLESEGMLSSAEINMIPGQQADAAVVAGKIAKVQGTKFGSEVYKQLFNKNGILDMANNLALAKDGDLNAWRNAQEQFVSVAQNAQSNLLDIQRGVYVKAAKEEWDKTVEIMGSFNYQYKYKPKVDGAYINAINQIQRAELLNENRPEGDTTDYVAKALEKYGEVISSMPQDRGEALQAWLEQGKRWLKVFNESVKKSGKVDVEKLEGFMDTDIESEIGYFPVWAKKTSYKGLLDNFYTITQQRNPYREWLRNGEWVPLDELEDPYTAMTRYTGFMTNNMGINDRNETIAKVLDRADLLVDNTPTDATIRQRKLDSIKNKDELLNKLDEMVEAKKKEVKEKTLTPKQYSDMMTKLYEDSAIEETAGALGNVDKNIVDSETMMVTSADYPGWDITDHPVWALDESSNDFDGMTRRDYYRNVKGKEFRVLEVPTNEYNQIMMEDDIGRMLGKEQMEIANSYVEKFKNGERADIPYIEYDKNGKIIGQEGRKRTAAAYKAGIKKVPVVIEYPVEAELPKNLRRYKDVTEKFVLRRKPSESDQQWNDFWKNAPAQTRKDIRDELEKTSIQTGFGISDTRARLNAQVPGFDVLDWSLLSREHTDGLYPGGLYSPLSIGYNGENFPVSVFILDINKLARLLDFNIDHIISNAKEDKTSLEKTANRIIEETNSIGGSPLLPLTMEPSSDGSNFKISIRGQDASSQEHSWGQYLAYLKEKGIEKVPVAILDKRNFSFPDNAWYSDAAKKAVKSFLDKLDSFVATAVLPEITPRELSAYFYLGHPYSDVYKKVRDNIPRDRLSDEKLESLISEAEEYDWSKDSELLGDIEKIRSKLPKAIGKDAKDITEDIKKAFSEYGQIPLFHNQHDPFGSLEFNDKAEVPTGEDRYTAKRGFGDALWISPNAKYTDQYGKNKLAATIPIKYFMSDKERVELITELNKKRDALETKALEKILKKIKDFNSSKKPTKHVYPIEKDGIGLNKLGFFSAPELPGNYVIDYAGNVYSRVYQSSPNSKGQDKVVLTPDDRKLPVAPNWFFTEHPSAFLTQKEKATLDTLQNIFLNEDEISYRALAEYSGKPVIDTTMDVIDKGIADGTAYFYYKGVSPEFDKEIGKQLGIQAKGEPYTLNRETIKKSNEWADKTTLDNYLDILSQKIDGIDDAIKKFRETLLDKGNYSDEGRIYLSVARNAIDDLEAKIDTALGNDPAPEDLALGVPLEYIMSTVTLNPSLLPNDILSSSLSELGFDISRNWLERFTIPQSSLLKALGIRDTNAENEQAWEAINPRNFANVPTEPQFKRPRKVTYEDYQKGLQADPAMAGRVQDSYRGALAQKLIKEITRVVGLAEDYLSPYSVGMDWQSNLNTSIIPDIQEAINQRMLPEEFNSFVQARMVKAIQDVAPYQSPELVLKSQLENVAQDWHDWAVKHIKSKRFTQKDLKEFVGSHNIELPNDKRPYPSKIKHALWEMVKNGKKLPKIEGFDANAFAKVTRAGDAPARPVDYGTAEYDNRPKTIADILYERSRAEQRLNDLIQRRQTWVDNGYMDELGLDVSKRELSKNGKEIPGTSKLDRIDVEIKTSKEVLSQLNSNIEALGGVDEAAKKDFYQKLDETPLFQSAIKDKNELVDLIAAEKNGETTDSYTMGVSAEALGLGGRYPIPWYKNGKPYTRFIKYDTAEHKRWAEEIVALTTDKEVIKEEGLISRFFSGAANDFRLLMTGWDPNRATPNLARDTTRSYTVGTRFIQTKKTLQSAIEMGNYSDKQKEILKEAINNAAEAAAGSSYNSSYRSPKGKQVSITKEYLSKNGANPMKRFFYNVLHDKRSILEWPMEFAEGYSRRSNARSLAAVQLGKDQAAGKSFDEQIKNAVNAANFAGREYTANFQRKGKLIGTVSKYIAYQSSAYAGLDGMLRAFIDNPKMVARNFAVFVLAYLILLSDTLSREETRNQYYRLSEYDRENQIVIGMGDSILTIPMDQELAGLLFPYRRIMETLQGTDPVSFFEFVWGTFTDWMPMDLSGFSEGDGFNLSRGLEKFTAQNMPTGLTPIQEAATGYDLYYGTDLSVSDETLRDYGIYAPQPGDYTTNGKDSIFLRNIANMTGIPQWQLQTILEGYGGNIGKYVLNVIDKAAGATKDQQGGKGFADTIFSSFTALDKDSASSAFYDGMTQLKKEKNKLLQKIADYNEDLKTASGDAKIEIQNKIQKAKDDFGVKAADFIDRYVSAYNITGGLSKDQAQQIYYLFRLDNDYTIYEEGSPEQYYKSQAEQKFKNQATAMSAPILDKYYNNRIGNVYQDADGVWRRYLSGGTQAMRNSIYGRSEEHMVNLLNILEGKESNLVNLRKKVRDARSAAFEAKDYAKRDKLGYEFDKQVINAISPYINKYGAENILGTNEVLDYLSDWFFVPDSFKRTKRGKYVSLANSGQTDEAFVRPFIKYVFGLPTNYYSYSDTALTSPSLEGLGR